MKPRRCAHHTYSIRASSDSPTSSAIRFSKPWSFAFENGRLFGSAHTRNVRDGCAHAAAAAATTAISATLGEAEDMQHASFRRYLAQRLHRLAPSRACGGVARVELVDHDRAGPTANAGENGDVLLAVGTAISDRLTDDSRGGLRAPQLLTRPRVDGFEPAIHRAVEDHVAGGCQCAAPRHERLFDLPRRLSPRRIPCRDLTEMAARSGVEHRLGANVRCARDVADLHRLKVHAQVVVRHIEQAGARREG